MKRAKRFNDGGMSLEEMYPGAKITRAGAQDKPGEYSANRFKVDEPGSTEKADRSARRTLDPYEAKASKMSRMGGGSGAGGEMGFGIQKMNKNLNRNYKTGGKVSASSRADGIAKRGRTKGRMV